MVYIALVAAVAALFIALTAVLATAEAQISIETLRVFAGYSDEPKILPDVTAALYGMPTEVAGLSVADDGGVLFLSTKCLSCHNVARGLNGNPPPGLEIVLVASDATAADMWLNRTGLSTTNVQIDIGGIIAERLGLTVTPAYIAVRDGQIAEVKALSSTRAVMKEHDQGRETVPEGGRVGFPISEREPTNDSQSQRKEV